MKWQKNTGVMPCGDDLDVKVRFRNGEELAGSAYIFEWSHSLSDPNLDITHYCIGEVTFPDFDYVEPKVWTVEPDIRNAEYKVFRYGVKAFSIDYANARAIGIKEDALIDALNAMEERNG